MVGRQWIDPPVDSSGSIVYNFSILELELDFPEIHIREYDAVQNNNPDIGSFDVTYDEPIFQGLDIEIPQTSYDRTFLIKDWEEKSTEHEPPSGFSIDNIYHSSNAPQSQYQYQSQSYSQYPTVNPPSITPEGHLEFVVPGNVTETFIFTARLDNGTENDFEIRILDIPYNSLSSYDFDYQKNQILNQPDLAQVVYDYKDLIEISPSNETLIDSYKDFIESIESRGIVLSQEEDLSYEVKLIGARILEIISTLPIPSYAVDELVKAEVLPLDLQMLDASIQKIIPQTNKINDILEASNLNYPRLEPIHLLQPVNLWDFDSCKFKLPITLKEKLFKEHSAQNIFIQKPTSSLIFKPETFLEDDPFNPLPDPEEILFESHKLANNKFDLKIIVDGNDNGSYNFQRPVHIHLPYEHNDPQTEHILTVIHDDDGTQVNKAGMYNNYLNRMYFGTKHFSVFFIIPSYNHFNDVNSEQNTWAQRFVESLAARGVISGVGNNNFDPNNEITRGATAVMIVNAFNLLEEVTNPPNLFNDVNEGDFFQTHVSTLRALRLARGSEGNFHPNNPIKREDCSIILGNTILLRHRNSLRLPNNPQNFFDNFLDKDDIANYSQRHVAFMLALNILRGDGNYLYPQAYLTRAQMATMIYKSLKIQNIQGLPYDILPRAIGVN